MKKQTLQIGFGILALLIAQTLVLVFKAPLWVTLITNGVFIAGFGYMAFRGERR